MKKQIISTLVLSIGILLPFSLHSQEQRKKVGVVLSGGGAKGMAHIKALKVIIQMGFSFFMKETDEFVYFLFYYAAGVSKTRVIR